MKDSRLNTGRTKKPQSLESNRTEQKGNWKLVRDNQKTKANRVKPRSRRIQSFGQSLSCLRHTGRSLAYENHRIVLLQPEGVPGQHTEKLHKAYLMGLAKGH